jgi:hypothetical protein
MLMGLDWYSVPDSAFDETCSLQWPHILINPTGNKALSIQEFRFMLNSAVEIVRIPFPVIFLHFVKDTQDRFYLAKPLNLSHNHTSIGLQNHSGKKAKIIEQPTLHSRRKDLKAQIPNTL